MRTPALLAAALLALPGCFGDGARDAAPDPVPAPPATAPLAAFLHGVSEPADGLSFGTAAVEQYRTPVDELVELDTWVARPRLDGPVPLVLEVTPYYGGGRPEDLGRVGLELLQRGYAVGVSSVRGTGQSGGCFTQGGPEEARDTAAVIAHLAGQPWSNGRVGLMGVSYPGTTPQDVWVEAPPALKAIVPVSGISDLYKYNFVNGVHVQPQGYAFNTYYWALEGPTPATAADGDPGHTATAAAGELCPEQAEVQEGGLTSAMDGNKDAYWQERDFHAELRADWGRNPQRAAVFYIHGLQDWNVKPHMMEDWLPALWESGVPLKVWLGQWGHAWPAATAVTEAGRCKAPADGELAACRADWWGLAMVAWFDQFLKGVDTGILDAPPVQVQDDAGRWRHEERWPPADAARHILRPTPDGRLGAVDVPGAVSYHDGWGSGDAAGLAQAPVALPGTQARWRSEPLGEDWTVSGFPVFHANVTASGARASLVLTLAEERPDGTLRAIDFCAQSLNHARSLESGDPDVSGLRQEVEVACFPQDDVLRAGSRLVLVASGNTVGEPAPLLTPLASGSFVTIETGGAWLELPVDHSLAYEDPQPYEK